MKIKEFKKNILVQLCISMTIFTLAFSILLNNIKYGLLLSLIFSLPIFLFIKYQYVLNRKTRCIEKEEIIAQGPANFNSGIQASGGWLYLTKSYLIFKPHSLNLKRDLIKIKTKDIGNLNKINHFWVFKNGLNIEKRNGTTMKFIVYNNDGWSKTISQLVS